MLALLLAPLTKRASCASQLVFAFVCSLLGAAHILLVSLNVCSNCDGKAVLIDIPLAFPTDDPEAVDALTADVYNLTEYFRENECRVLPYQTVLQLITGEVVVEEGPEEDADDDDASVSVSGGSKFTTTLRRVSGCGGYSRCSLRLQSMPVS